MTEHEQELFMGDDASYLAPGDFVSFVFNNERIIAYLVNTEIGLRSSERTRSGYWPFIVKKAGTVAAGVSSLREIQEPELVMRLATNLLRPGNEHFVDAIEKMCHGNPRRGGR